VQSLNVEMTFGELNNLNPATFNGETQILAMQDLISRVTSVDIAVFTSTRQ
jgi:hypothetical protein